MASRSPDSSRTPTPPDTDSTETGNTPASPKLAAPDPQKCLGHFYFPEREMLPLASFFFFERPSNQPKNEGAIF